MTREEIEKLPIIIAMVLDESVLVDTKEKIHEKLTEVCNLAIKALEQEPCEDAISRQAELEYIEGSEAELGHSSENELVCQDIKELPPVTPQPKTAYVIVDEDGNIECSNCGSYECWGNYCINCGAKMVDPQESEDKE